MCRKATSVSTTEVVRNDRVSDRDDTWLLFWLGRSTSPQTVTRRILIRLGVARRHGSGNYIKTSMCLLFRLLSHVLFRDITMRPGILFHLIYVISLALIHSNMRLGYRIGTARRNLEIFSTAAQLYKNPIWRKICNRWIILKVAQGHRNCRYSMGDISLPIHDL